MEDLICLLNLEVVLEFNVLWRFVPLALRHLQLLTRCDIDLCLAITLWKNWLRLRLQNFFQVCLILALISYGVSEKAWFLVCNLFVLYWFLHNVNHFASLFFPFNTVFLHWDVTWTCSWRYWLCFRLTCRWRCSDIRWSLFLWLLWLGLLLGLLLLRFLWRFRFFHYFKSGNLFLII